MSLLSFLLPFLLLFPTLFTTSSNRNSKVTESDKDYLSKHKECKRFISDCEGDETVLSCIRSAGCPPHTLVSHCQNEVSQCADEMDDCLKGKGLMGCSHTGYKPTSLDDLHVPVPPPPPVPPPKVIAKECAVAVADCRETDAFLSCMSAGGCTEPPHLYLHVTHCVEAERMCRDVVSDCVLFLLPGQECTF